MNEQTKSKLLELWQQAKDEGAWSVFGGTFTVDGQDWQVVPMGKTWIDGNFVDQKPKFLKCS